LESAQADAGTLATAASSFDYLGAVRQTFQLRVRYADTDAAGIVHYARYLGYLEVARAEALRSAGLTRKSVASFLLAAPVLNAKLQYRAPARFDDLLDVAAWVTKVLDEEFHWVYEIRKNADQGLVLVGETVHWWSDGEGSPRRSNVPSWVRDVLQRLEATSES
jgi:acyl-CoA thioester hydrolase